jgi:hypothetical protein
MDLRTPLREVTRTEGLEEEEVNERRRREPVVRGRKVFVRWR